MRTTALIKRVLKEMMRDKRTLALMFLGPLLILTLMYFLFQSNSNQNADLAVRNVDTTLVKAVKNKHLKVHQISSNAKAKKIIREHDYAGLLAQKGDKLTLTLQNSDQSKSSIVKNSLRQAQVKLKMQASAATLKTQKKAIQKLQQALATLAKQTGIPVAGQTAPSQQPRVSGQIIQ